jgi:hypothetical protein
VNRRNRSSRHSGCTLRQVESARRMHLATGQVSTVDALATMTETPCEHDRMVSLALDSLAPALLTVPAMVHSPSSQVTPCSLEVLLLRRICTTRRMTMSRQQCRQHDAMSIDHTNVIRIRRLTNHPAFCVCRDATQLVNAALAV